MCSLFFWVWRKFPYGYKILRWLLAFCPSFSRIVFLYVHSMCCGHDVFFLNYGISYATNTSRLLDYCKELICHAWPRCICDLWAASLECCIILSEYCTCYCGLTVLNWSTWKAHFLPEFLVTARCCSASQWHTYFNIFCESITLAFYVSAAWIILVSFTVTRVIQGQT